MLAHQGSVWQGKKFYIIKINIHHHWPSLAVDYIYNISFKQERESMRNMASEYFWNP